MAIKVNNMFEVLLAVVIIFSLAIELLPDSFEDLANLNESISGLGILKILGVVVAGGIVYKMYKMTQSN